MGNSPQTIRKHYMDLLRADHKREAELELAIGQGSPMADKTPISPDNTVYHDVPEMVTREQVEQLLEAQKTAGSNRIATYRTGCCRTISGCP